MNYLLFLSLAQYKRKNNMMDKRQMTVYLKPNDPASDKALAAAELQSPDVLSRNVLEEPLTPTQLLRLATKCNANIRDFIDPKTLDQQTKKAKITDDELAEMLAQHPEWLQHPIAELGDKAVLVSVPGRVKDLVPDEN